MKAHYSGKIYWSIVCFIFTMVASTVAQNVKLVPQSTKMTIYGTSNLHKWDMKVEQVSGDLSVNGARQITSLSIRIPVQSIKSENSIMDKKTYVALKSDKNPNITFQLSDASPIRVSDNNVDVTLTGNLTVAGVTKKISFKSTGKLISDKAYQLTGSVALKMTDFNVKPPTAMFGTLKTGDEVTVKFVVTVTNVSFN